MTPIPARVSRRFPLLLAALLLIAAPAAGQLAVPPLDAEETRTAHEAMSRLRSPYTGSHTVDMCPSAGALRDSIRVSAAAGMSTEQIVEEVVGRHGEQLRLLPKRRGAGLLAWVATPLVMLLGAAFVFRRFDRAGDASANDPGPDDALNSREREELAAAMRRFEATGEAES